MIQIFLADGLTEVFHEALADLKTIIIVEVIVADSIRDLWAALDVFTKLFPQVVHLLEEVKIVLQKSICTFVCPVFVLCFL